MDKKSLMDEWKREEQEPFTGWDFSHVDSRMIEEQAPWSYTTRASELMRPIHSVIDLGTGGGERFLKLQSFWPAKVVVTEDYPPNVQLATERLSPYGVRAHAAAFGESIRAESGVAHAVEVIECHAADFSRCRFLHRQG